MNEWIPIADAKIDRSKRYEVTDDIGYVTLYAGNHIPKTVLAVREYNPKPYVPPKPKRMTCVVAGMDLREVLPGDPDPDRVIETIETMRKYEGYAAGDLNFWADKLEGKNE